MLVHFLISFLNNFSRNGGPVQENLSRYNFGTYTSNNLKARHIRLLCVLFQVIMRILHE